MTRYIDRGAIVAGWVGVGMAATIATSFLLVIPIEPVYWYLALPSGLLIGYYANRRAGRAGAGIRRLLVNGLWAGVVTAVVYAALLLYLMGIARDEKELDIVVNYARSLPYVKQVVNHVILRDDPRRAEKSS